MVASTAEQRLFTHPVALDRETTLPNHELTVGLLADFWFQSGPRAAATFGLYRAFELELGVVYDTDTPMTAGAEFSRSLRFMATGTLAMFSYRSVMLKGGLAMAFGDGDLPDTFLTANLTVPLDAPWLPFRLTNARARVTYPIGLGIEWGVL
jgi:hypothetical protein